MKLEGPWVIGAVALMSLGLVTVEPAHSEQQGGLVRCPLGLATLKGLYMFAQSGNIIGLGPQGVTGKSIFYGNGAFDSLATISTNGVISVAPAPGTYTVNSDCTGTVTVEMPSPPGNVHLDIFVTPDGSEIFTIETDPGTVLAGTERRVAP